jgi:exopolysaccharide production protein ExoQ
MRPMGRSGFQDQPRLGVPFNLSACLVFGALAALILNPLFGSVAALVFLLFGGLLLALQPMQSLNAILQHRWLLLLPAYCAVSTLWSQFPDATLRYSIQLAITFFIAIVIATRISPATLLRCLYAIYGIGVAGSILIGRVRDDTGAWVGIFGSKNALAAIVTGFALTSLALLLDRTASRLLRLIAFASVLLAGPMLLLAQSTGSLIFIGPASAAIVAVIVSRRVSPLQKLGIATATGLVAVLAVTLLFVHGDALFEFFLDVTGKDVTLTGRTDLWEAGFGLIAQNPLFGVGYQAFWVKDYGPAEDLWAMFGIDSRAGFNFHNTYVSNAVEIGLVGVAIQVAMIYGAFIGILRWALSAPCSENAYLLGFLVMLIGSSFIEVGVYFQFSITTIIALSASVYAMRYQEWRRTQRVAGADPVQFKELSAQ